MYKLDLPVDLAEQAAIERRRRLEKERASRIFNNKHRLIGIDKEALDQQINDKKFMEEMEQKRSEAFGTIYYLSTKSQFSSMWLIFWCFHFSSSWYG